MQTVDLTAPQGQQSMKTSTILPAVVKKAQSLSILDAGEGLQIVGLAALLIRLSLWLGLLSHRRRLSNDTCEATTLPIEARASASRGKYCCQAWQS